MAAILLIEDDPHQRAYATLVLESAGHVVTQAPDGQEGLRQALAQAPELIVCDVVMPGMNGYQLVAAVRREAAICTTPVILLTSLAERAQVRVGMNAGADDYLPKPFKPPELLEAVDALLQRRKVQYEAITGSMMQDMDAALAHQRELLASRYETQLVNELGSKWKIVVEAGRETVFERAAVVVADLFSVVERAVAGRPDAGELLKRVHAAAQDVLYLFGAGHVLPHGGDIVAVFGPDTQGRVNLLNPIRAAFGLQSAAASVLASLQVEGISPAVALAVGPLSLLRLQDPLHGDAGSTPVPGVTLQMAQSLRSFARAGGWQVVMPASLLGGAPVGAFVSGRTAQSPEGPVVELLRPKG